MTFWKRITQWFEDDGTDQPKPMERISPRFDTKMVISFDGESAASETQGNVGIGGFCFLSDRIPRTGQVIDLLIDLDGFGHWVLVRGEVLGIISQKDQVGVRGRFTRIAFEEERHLARWIDCRALAAAA